MSNIKTIIDEWSVRDLEDGSYLNISVLGCTELGSQSKPGIQVCFMDNTINYEPLSVERWAYLAYRAEALEYLLAEYSWMACNDQYIKNYLLPGTPLKVRVEVKTRSSRPVIKEYTLPFELGAFK